MLYFVVVMQSFIMNSHEVFIHIHQGCFAGTGAIVRLPQIPCAALTSGNIPSELWKETVEESILEMFHFDLIENIPNNKPTDWKYHG